MVKQNERRLVRHSLLEVNGHYEVDLVKMEQQIIEEKVKLLLFVIPIILVDVFGQKKNCWQLAVYAKTPSNCG